jgi:hypothetical protein
MIMIYQDMVFVNTLQRGFLKFFVWRENNGRMMGSSGSGGGTRRRLTSCFISFFCVAHAME